MEESGTRKRRAAFLIKGLISAGLLWYLLSTIDLAPLAERFSSVQLMPIVAAVIILCVQILVVSLRWRIVVESMARRFEFFTLLKYVLIGLFFNQALPTALGGDIVRAWYIHLAGVRGRHAVYSVLLDRLAALAASALLMLMLISLVFERVPDPAVRGGFIIVVAAIGVGFVFLFSLDRLRIHVLSELVAGLGTDLAVAARKVFFRFRSGVNVVGLSACSLCCTIMVVYLIGAGFGVEVTLRDCFILVPPVILMTMVPISIAGWGVRELAMVQAFGYANVADADSLLLSIGLGMLTLLISLPGGIVWLVAARSAPPPDVTELESD